METSSMQVSFGTASASPPVVLPLPVLPTIATSAEELKAAASSTAAAAAARARRRRTTGAELEILEEEFLHCDKPDMETRERISRRIALAEGPGMNGREIQVWFQNKRQAVRRAKEACVWAKQQQQQQQARGDPAQSALRVLAPAPASSSSGSLAAPLSACSSASISSSELPTASAPANASDTSTSMHHATQTDVPQASAVLAHPVATFPRHAPAEQVVQQPQTPSEAPKRVHHKPRRLASLQLQDLDGHAELVFQPAAELAPVSPPREPGLALLTKRFQQQQRVNKKRQRLAASRSVSSPALLGPLQQQQSQSSAASNRALPAKTKLKHATTASVSATATTTAARGKENISPWGALPGDLDWLGRWQALGAAASARYLPASPSHLRDIPQSASRVRRVVSAPAHSPLKRPTPLQPAQPEPQYRQSAQQLRDRDAMGLPSSQATYVDPDMDPEEMDVPEALNEETEDEERDLSLEECALSLVGLARGG